MAEKAEGNVADVKNLINNMEAQIEALNKLATSSSSNSLQSEAKNLQDLIANMTNTEEKLFDSLTAGLDLNEGKDTDKSNDSSDSKPVVR
mmetsp:Transcript_12474/g.18617  ORF Transcript_12474/g.18617 Transcript_12474/m.18617 type:complete len:90 (+) Transcript_12474:141-410(+)